MFIAGGREAGGGGLMEAGWFGGREAEQTYQLMDYYSASLHQCAASTPAPSFE